MGDLTHTGFNLPRACLVHQGTCTCTAGHASVYIAPSRRDPTDGPRSRSHIELPLNCLSRAPASKGAPKIIPYKIRILLYRRDLFFAISMAYTHTPRRMCVCHGTVEKEISSIGRFPDFIWNYLWITPPSMWGAREAIQR